MKPLDYDTVIRRIFRDGRITLKSQEYKGFLVCAQPGSGKTRLATMLEERQNAAFINADEYRRYYPEYRELFREKGDEVISMTRAFSGRVTEILIDQLSAKGYNLIVEGTLRTTEVPEKTAALLKARGYRTELDVLLVKPEISWLRTLKRYEEMKDSGTTPRRTARENHDRTAAALPDNLETLWENGVFHEIRVYQDKEGELCCLYSSRDTPEKNPAELVRREFSRPYTAKEMEAVRKDYGAYLPEKDFNALFAGKMEKEKSRRPRYRGWDRGMDF